MLYRIPWYVEQTLAPVLLGSFAAGVKAEAMRVNTDPWFFRNRWTTPVGGLTRV